MTDRSATFLDRLGLVLMAAALLLPLGLGLAQVVAPRPHLQWAVVSVLSRSDNYLLQESGRYGYGYSIMLVNSGSAATDPVRIVLDQVPEHVDVLGHGDDHALQPTGLGLDIALDPILPGHYTLIEIFGLTSDSTEAVLEGSRAVEEGTLHRSSFADPRPWLPNWAIAALGLLLSGLLLRGPGLRGRWRGPEPEVALGRAAGTARMPPEPYRS